MKSDCYKKQIELTSRTLDDITTTSTILNDLQIRREMDDKLRLERNSLKEALDASHAGDKERAIEATRLQQQQQQQQQQ